MKTVTIVINQDSQFAPTQIHLRDDFGLRRALDLIREKGFGNYSKNRFFFEISFRNFDGEELVAYVGTRMVSRWDDIQGITDHLSTLSSTWMLGESRGSAFLGGYVCHILSDEWYEDITDQPAFKALDWLESEPQRQFRGDVFVRAKRAVPLLVGEKQ